jgi:serine/threonine protein kinase
MPTDDPSPPKVPESKTVPYQDTKSTRDRQTTTGQEQEFEVDAEANAPKTIGKYEIRRLLGKGGMGAVYLAFDPLIEREVAIKVLHSQLSNQRNSVQRFLGEARAVGKLNHPNAIAIYEIGAIDGDYFIVMELAEGGSVRDLLLQQPSISLAEACRITIEAARGLEAAHRLGLIHRDIKPENLMLSANGRVKIVDFGLARQIDRSPELALTQTGQLLGTPYYMSPEQIRSGSLDARTDIYSLGVTLFQMLTGQMPFTGDSVAQVVYSHLNADRPDPTELRAGLPELCAAIVAKSMAVDAEDRYDAMYQMIRDIEKLASTVTDATVGGDSSETGTGVVPRVMIAEPSKLAAKILSDVFRGAGCEDIHCVQSAGEAIGRASTMPPDIVVAARQLPDAKGESMLEQVVPKLVTREPLCVLLSSDDPVDLMASSDLTGTCVFARKQSPDDIPRAIDCCSDYALAGLPAPPTRDRAVSVTIVSSSGTVDEELTDWLGDWGITPVTLDTRDPVPNGPETEYPELILWIQPSGDTRNSLVECLRGPFRSMIERGSAVALLEETAAGTRLQILQRRGCVVSCDKSFDRSRLARILRHC